MYMNMNSFPFFSGLVIVFLFILIKKKGEFKFCFMVFIVNDEI